MLFLTAFGSATFSHAQTSSGTPKTSFRTEVGSVETRYNVVKIPTTGGTEIRLPTRGSQFAYRFYLHHAFSENWDVRFMFAPLTAKYEFTPTKNVTFNGTDFSPGRATVLTYQFNSYRLGARYQWLNTEQFKSRVGFIAKWREAFTKVQQDSTVNMFSGDGFVPLAHFSLEWWPWEQAFVNFDVDGLGSVQGRAIDALLEIGYRPEEWLQAALGHRIVEGGANNDRLYTFAQFNYWLASVTVSW
jgi:hypothetical protein